MTCGVHSALPVKNRDWLDDSSLGQPAGTLTAPESGDPILRILYGLPALTQSLPLYVARFIPRIFRIMDGRARPLRPGIELQPKLQPVPSAWESVPSGLDAALNTDR